MIFIYAYLIHSHTEGDDYIVIEFIFIYPCKHDFCVSECEFNIYKSSYNDLRLNIKNCHPKIFMVFQMIE